MKCPNCGAELAGDGGPCPECGNRRTGDDSASDFLLQPDSAERFPCPQCGRGRSLAEDPCAYCGFAPPKEKGKPKRFMGLTSFQIGIIVLVVFLWIGLFFGARFAVSRVFRRPPKPAAAPPAELVQEKVKVALASDHPQQVVSLLREIPRKHAEYGRVSQHLVLLCLDSNDLQACESALWLIPGNMIGKDDLRTHVKVLKKEMPFGIPFEEVGSFEKSEEAIYFIYTSDRDRLAYLKIAAFYKRKRNKPPWNFHLYFFGDRAGAAKALPFDDNALACWTGEYEYNRRADISKLRVITPEETAAILEKRRKENREFLETPAGKIHAEHPDWNRELCADLADGKVYLGFTQEQCRIARGDPTIITEIDYTDYIEIRWCYGENCERSLYFVEGLLTRQEG